MSHGRRSAAPPPAAMHVGVWDKGALALTVLKGPELRVEPSGFEGTMSDHGVVDVARDGRVQLAVIVTVGRVAGNMD